MRVPDVRSAPDALPDLVVTKTGPVLVAPGGSASYTITVANAGTGDGTDAVLTDTLPAPLVFAAASDGGAPVRRGVVRWALGTLTPGSSRSVSLRASVPATATVARVENVAVATTLRADAHGDDNTGRWGSDLLPVDLRAEIAPRASEVRPGEALTHAVLVANVSALPAEGVVIEMTLAAGTTFVTATAAMGDAAADPIRTEDGVRWELPRMDGPSTWAIDVVTRVGSDVVAGSEIVHRVGVRARTLDSDPTNNQRSASAVPVVVPDLWIRTTAPAAAQTGTELTYTMHYGNEGGGTAPRARISDTLPAAVEFVSSIPPATIAERGVLTWDLGDLPPRAIDIVRLRTRVTARSGTVVDNTASIGSDAPDVDAANNAATARTTVAAGAPMHVAVSAPLTLTVGGAQVAIGATIVDAFGDPVADGTAVLADTSLGRLAATNLRTDAGRITTTLTSGTTPGTARVSMRAGDVVAAADVGILAGEPARVRLSVDPARPTVGQTVTIGVEAADAFGNAVRDGTPVKLEVERGRITPAVATIGAGRAQVAWYQTAALETGVRATVGSASDNRSVTFAPGAASAVELSITPATLALDSGTAVLRATVRDAFGNGVVNGTRVSFTAEAGRLSASSATTTGGMAAVTYRAGGAPGRYLLAAATAAVRAEVSVDVRPADLHIGNQVVGPRGPARTTKTYPGEELSLELTVRNRDLARARGVFVASALDAAMIVRSVTGSRPVTETLHAPPGLDAAPRLEQVQRFWALPDLEPDGVVTITITGVLDRARTWPALRTLFFQSVVTSTTPLASTTGLAHTDIAAVYTADRHIATTVNTNASNLRRGGEIVYEIAFGNNSAGDDGTIRITDTLPVGTTFAQWQPGPRTELRTVGRPDDTSRVVVWEGEAAALATGEVSLWLTIDDDAPLQSVIENIVEIGGSVYDANPANDRASDSGVWLEGVNLVSAIEAPVTIAPGEVLRHVVRLRNLAPVDEAADVVLEAVPPAGLELLRTTPIALVQPDGRARWLSERLSAGGEMLVSLEFQVPGTASVGAEYTMIVDATSRQPESAPGDNRAEARTRVVPGQASSIVVAADEDALVACGVASTKITAVVRDRFGNRVTDGTLLRWSATAGTLDRTVSATADGVSTVVLTAARRTGTATVSVAAGAASSTLTVPMVPGPPKALAVSADPNVVGRGGRVMLTVNVLDACGNTVADAWPITLSSDGGTFEGGGASVALPTRAGQVRVRLHVGDVPRVLRVRASHGGEFGQTVVTVQDRPARPTIYLPLASR